VKRAAIELGRVIPDDKRGGGAIRDLSGFADDSFPVRVDKLLRQAGLAVSNTEAASNVKSGSVSIEGTKIDPQDILVNLSLNKEITIRVGRRMKKVRIIDPIGGSWQ
jgi:ribosomal 50S subunit-recycling heat shock protein